MTALTLATETAAPIPAIDAEQDEQTAKFIIALGLRLADPSKRKGNAGENRLAAIRQYAAQAARAVRLGQQNRLPLHGVRAYSATEIVTLTLNLRDALDKVEAGVPGYAPASA